MPLVRRTRATLRRAEFGFFGVLVYTRVHTPRRCGAPLSAGVLPLAGFDSRPLRTSCWMVGTEIPFKEFLVLRWPLDAEGRRGRLTMLRVAGAVGQTVRPDGSGGSAGVAARRQVDDLGVGLVVAGRGVVAVAGGQIGSPGQPLGQIGLLVGRGVELHRLV